MDLDAADAIDILKRLEIAVLEPITRSTLKILHSPGWLQSMLPGQQTTELAVDDIFPVLSGFLELAKGSADKRLLSDIWVQLTPDGCDVALRATVLSAPRPIILLERLGEEYEERRLSAQRARDRGLENEILERRSRDSDRLAAEKSEFLAGISHDLRTPLNAMLGFSRILLQERAGPLNDKQRDYVDHVIQSAIHLQDLVNDVLDLSRVEAGLVGLQPEPLRPAAVVAEIVATLAPLADSRGVMLSAGSWDGMLNADPVRFRQILYNLVSNAIKFTATGGHVSITFEPQTNELQICVTDTGMGIPPEEQEAVFRRFYQVRATNVRDGSGLGLAMTRRLVELHGGRIWVESKPGAGSRFVFTVPGKPC